MPEKQAKGLGEAEKSETFQIKEGSAKTAAGGEKQIVLNIAEARGGKILLRQKGQIAFTGNAFIDTFRRLNQFVIDHSKVSIRDKATFFRLLAVMLNAGL